MAERGRVYNKIYTPELWEQVNKENKTIMNDYLEEYKQRKKAKGTISQYFNDLRIVMIFILNELGNQSLLDLKKKDFRRFNIWCQDKNMSNARVNRLMSSIRSMLTYVEDDEEYDYDINFASKVKGLQKDPVKITEDNFFMSYEQIFKIRDELIKRGELKLAVLHMILFDSAGRRNEVHQILKLGILEGNKTNIVIGKRAKKFQLVYLNDTKELIREYLEERGEDDIDSLWIIGKGDKKRPASYESIYDWVLKISKIFSEIEGREINIFCHSYRHSRVESLLQGSDARLLDKDGKPRVYTLEEVQKFCHHSSSDVTASYAKNHDDDVIDDMFGI
jgi:integrase/recombinase XerD